MTPTRLITTAVALLALAAPSAASAADRDKDRMRDSWEKHYKLNPRTNDARKDKDRDGLRNLEEYRAGTNPRKRDTDADGRRDDREGAGIIKSFDAQTGVLVIDQFASDQDLTGKVDSSTKIECEDERRSTTPGTGDTRGDGTPEDAPGSPPGDTRGDGTPEDNKLARSSDDDDRSGSNSGHGGGDDDRSGSNSGSGSGDDDGRRDDDERICTTAELDAGRTVKEAELHTGDDGPNDVFDEIELIVR